MGAARGNLIGNYYVKFDQNLFIVDKITSLVHATQNSAYFQSTEAMVSLTVEALISTNPECASGSSLATCSHWLYIHPYQFFLVESCALVFRPFFLFDIFEHFVLCFCFELWLYILYLCNENVLNSQKHEYHIHPQSIYHTVCYINSIRIM